MSPARVSAEEVDALLQSIAVTVAALRDGNNEPELSGVLKLLANHSSFKVRRAVAEGLIHAPDACFDALIEELQRDRNAYVSAAAEKAFNARSARRLTDRRRTEKAAQERELLEELELSHGRAARRLAERARDRALEAFVSRFRHELAKAAATLPRSLERVVEESKRPSPQGILIQTEAEQANAAYDLFMKIFDSAQSYARAYRPSFKTELLREILEHARQQLLDRSPEQADRLIVEIDCVPDLAIEVDRALLIQALSNVIQNALEAYRTDGDSPMRIAMSARALRKGTQVELTVRDWGMGISESSAPYVGEVFRSSKGGTGRGLGIANVKKMVESVHGGMVTIRGARGEGTTVTMVLPRLQGKAS